MDHYDGGHFHLAVACQAKEMLNVGTYHQAGLSAQILLLIGVL